MRHICLYPPFIMTGNWRVLRAVAVNVYTTVLRITKKEEEFVFNDISERPTPSILRGFSAPIRLESDLTDSIYFSFLLMILMSLTGQVLARKLMLSLVADFQQNKALVLNPQFLQGMKSILNHPSLDKEFIAKAITLPGVGEIMDMMTVADPDAVHAVRTFIRKQLASELKEELLITLILDFEEPEITELLLNEYRNATNMTDQFAALVAIDQQPAIREEILADFYNKWQHDYLVVNKWLALQAMSDMPGNVENVKKLLNHTAFDPLIRIRFIQVDRRILWLHEWCQRSLGEAYDEARQSLAKEQLEMILSTEGLSENVFEIASKSLAA
ncbi:hypothetical protein HAX54_000907 [Datura stramonium]|uniref:Uncharacterized protein n=1 Tax=Datura stramonium TaxID=4076 RepID=A0ABS8T2M6_DATST|nr:hypothetical protein [Datura stramonium]